MRQIILDTETTGLSPEQGHRIIEIAGIELVDRLFTGNHFHVYINPKRPVDPQAQKVHGISNQFLQDKPIFSQIYEELLTYLGDAEIIAHNASFDLGFLNHEFNRIDQQFGKLEQRCKVTDTLAMAKKLHLGQRNNLDALCKRYQIDNTKRTLHGALMDAQLLAMVYLAMTGGQSNMFDMLEPTSAQTQQDTAPELSTSNSPTRVIKASEMEEQAHHAYLEKMQKKGTSVWLSTKRDND